MGRLLSEQYLDSGEPVSSIILPFDQEWFLLDGQLYRKSADFTSSSEISNNNQTNIALKGIIGLSRPIHVF